MRLWFTGGMHLEPLANPLFQTSALMELCALRFNGYTYARTRSSKVAPEKLVRRFCETLSLSSQPEENFALFFFLHQEKQAGSWLASWKRETEAAAFLFLHLYHQPTPDKWIAPGAERDWRRVSATAREKTAALLRQRLAEQRY